MWDPATTSIDADVQLRPDVSLLPGKVLKCHSQIGGGAQIGPNACFIDAVIGEWVVGGTIEATGVTNGAGVKVVSFVVLESGQVVNAEPQVSSES